MTRPYPFWKYCLDNGSGNLAFVWYVAGMPWAVSSCKIASLEDDVRRRMFGYRNTAGGRPADDVHILPCLEIPGNQTIKSEDTKGMPSGGAWTAEIADENPGVTWQHTTRDVWGLDGLSTMPDYRIDSDIHAATLSATFDKDDTTIYIKNDYGDRLRTAIDAATGDRLFLWVGKECVQTSAATVNDGDEAFHVTVVRGIYKTRPQSHFVGLGNVKPIIVADAPLGGIVGRDYYLYAIVLDDDNVPVSEAGIGTLAEVACVRHGAVGSRISRDRGMFKVSCNAWFDNLKQKVKTETARGTLRGYYFTHGDDSATSDIGDQTHGHMIIWENPVLNDTWVPAKIWLCPEDSGVFFETKQAALNALQDEIQLAYELGGVGTTANGSEPISYVYNVRWNGLFHDEQDWPQSGAGPYVPEPGYASFVTGVVPWALNLCAPNRIGDGGWCTASTMEQLRAGLPIEPGQPFYTTDDIRWGWARRCYWGDLLQPPLDYNDTSTDLKYSTYGSVDSPDDKYLSPYFYQYDWDSLTGTNGLQNFRDEISEFPVPSTNIAGNKPYLYLGWDDDVNNFNDSEEIFVGARDRYLGGIPTLSRGDIDGVTTATNHIEVGLTDSDGSYWEAYGPYPLLHNVNAVDEDGDSVFRVGSSLYYFPGIHDESAGGDPWPVHQPTYKKADQASAFFKALLGDDSAAVSIPESFEFNNIPDAVSLSISGDVEFYESIDWDSFDDIVQKPFPSAYYALDLSEGDISLYDLLAEVLKLHGACATWEYDATKFQFVMRFRPIGTVNISEAQSTGRTLGIEERELYAFASGEHSGDRLVNVVEAHFQYSELQDKYLINIKVDDELNASATGGRRQVMKINDKLTRLNIFDSSATNDVNAVRDYFTMNHLLKLAWPMPTQTVDSTLRSVIENPAGVAVLLTDPGASNTYTGGRGLTAQPALITQIGTNYKDGGRSRVSYRLSPQATKDWAPAVYITANNSVVTDANTITVSGWSANRYGTTRDNMSYFGNFTYNTSTDETTQVDTDPYICNVYQEGVGGLVYEDVSVVVNGAISQAVLTKTGIGASWLVAKNYIMTYADFDSSLHAAQRHWLYFAEEDGTIRDDAATVTPGREWE